MKYYLAHPIKDRSWVRKKELVIESDTGIELVNPFYDDDRHDISDIDNGITHEFSIDIDFEKIVRNDLSHIDNSDGVVAVITESKTVGTIMELMYARMTDKNVWIICMDNELFSHPWLRYVSDNKIYRSFEEWRNELHPSKY